jgi:YVTN family beta-propeller protein
VFRSRYLLFPALAVSGITGCSHPAPVQQAEQPSAFRIYVTNEISGDMTIIDSATYNVVATIPLGKRPRGIHASPDKKTIYVALSGSPPAPPGVDESTLPPPDHSADGIGVFDVAQNKLVRMLKAGSDPENFDVSPDGKTIYVSNEDASGVSFVDVASGELTKTIKTGEEPEGVKVNLDGKLVYSTNEEDGTVSVIDTVAGTLVKTFKVGRRPRNIVFMPDGAHGYVNAENDSGIVLFDPLKYKQIQPIKPGTPGEIKPMFLLLSPDAAKLYVSTGRGHKVFIVGTATNQPTGSFEVGQRPWGMAFSPDAKLLYTANGPSNDVSVVDLATQTVTRKIKASGSPWGVVVF